MRISGLKLLVTGDGILACIKFHGPSSAGLDLLQVYFYDTEEAAQSLGTRKARSENMMKKIKRKKCYQCRSE